MVRGIVIPAVTFLPLEERDFESLSDYQAAVGGYIEPISIAEPALTLYVNEDGKSRQMSVNERATVLWWLLAPHARSNDIVAGDAVLLFEDQTADTGFLRQLQQDHGFQVEVQVAEAIGDWVAGGRKFGSWFEAARFALAVDQRFEFVVAVRVTAV